jgi:hypothetical protein
VNKLDCAAATNREELLKASSVHYPACLARKHVVENQIGEPARIHCFKEIAVQRDQLNPGCCFDCHRPSFKIAAGPACRR